MESSLGDEDRSLRREEIVIEYWLILLYSDIVDFINGCSISMIIYCNKTIKSDFLDAIASLHLIMSVSHTHFIKYNKEDLYNLLGYF